MERVGVVAAARDDGHPGLFRDLTQKRHAASHVGVASVDEGRNSLPRGGLQLGDHRVDVFHEVGRIRGADALLSRLALDTAEDAIPKRRDAQ